MFFPSERTTKLVLLGLSKNLERSKARLRVTTFADGISRAWSGKANVFLLFGWFFVVWLFGCLVGSLVICSVDEFTYLLSSIRNKQTSKQLNNQLNPKLQGLSMDRRIYGISIPYQTTVDPSLVYTPMQTIARTWTPMHST